MGFFKKKVSKENVEKMIKERNQLANEIIPTLQEEIRKNPSNWELHIELVKVLATVGRLDEAKTESNAAMLKIPVSDRQQIWGVQAEIERLISKRDLEY